MARHVEFSAIASSTSYSYLSVTGTYQVNVTLDGTPYAVTLILVQSGSAITGTFLDYNAAPGGASLFTISTGSVIGTTISFDGVNGGLTTHFTGTIAVDGTMSGTWADTVGGTRTGTWATTSGNATVATGGFGKGTLAYSDASGNWYRLGVKYVKVVDNTAWFAGQITAGNILIGSWLFVKVVDGGEPSIGADQTSGAVFATETEASNAVATMAQPFGPFFITDGNIQVH